MLFILLFLLLLLVVVDTQLGVALALLFDGVLQAGLCLLHLIPASFLRLLVGQKGEGGEGLDVVLGWKLMSCSHVKSYVNFLLIINSCSLLCSQSGARLLVDTTLDNDYNSKVSTPEQEMMDTARYVYQAQHNSVMRETFND